MILAKKRIRGTTFKRVIVSMIALLGLCLMSKLLYHIHLQSRRSRLRDEIHASAYCASKLRAIGQACYIYAQDDGYFPTQLSLLVEDDLIKEHDLRCSTMEDAGTSYQYVPGSALDSSVERILCFEEGEAHGQGRYVLFQDGHVDFIDSIKFKRLAREQGMDHTPIIE